MTLRLAQFGYSAEELKAIPAEDFAGPNQSFPIKTANDVKDAWDLAGHAADPSAVRTAIKTIAKRKGLEEALPTTADKGSFAFLIDVASFGTEQEWIPWEHKIFEAGTYPNQGVDANQGYLDKMVANFRPVKLKNSHTNDPQSIFSKVALGTCDSIRREGNDLIGKGKMHQVVRMISDAPKASIEILDKDTDPKLSAIALLNFPQVDDAKVAACYAKFASMRHSAADVDHIQAIHDHAAQLGATCAPMDGQMGGARHSKADQADIQQMHDLAVSQGATCTAAGAQMGAIQPNDPARRTSTAKENQMNPTIWEKVKAFFGQNSDKAKESGFTSEELANLAIFTPPADTAPSAFSKLDPVLAAEFEKLKADNAETRAQFEAITAAKLTDRAAQFASQCKADRKILPAEEAHIASLFVMAAKADGDGKAAKFGADGSVIEGDNVKALKSAMEARRTLAIFETEIPNARPMGVAGDQVAAAHQTLATAVDAYNKRGRN